MRPRPQDPWACWCYGSYQMDGHTLQISGSTTPRGQGGANKLMTLQNTPPKQPTNSGKNTSQGSICPPAWAALPPCSVPAQAPSTLSWPSQKGPFYQSRALSFQVSIVLALFLTLCFSLLPPPPHALSVAFSLSLFFYFIKPAFVTVD